MTTTIQTVFPRTDNEQSLRTADFPERKSPQEPSPTEVVASRVAQGVLCISTSRQALPAPTPLKPGSFFPVSPPENGANGSHSVPLQSFHPKSPTPPPRGDDSGHLAAAVESGAFAHANGLEEAGRVSRSFDQPSEIALRAVEYDPNALDELEVPESSDADSLLGSAVDEVLKSVVTRNRARASSSGDVAAAAAGAADGSKPLFICTTPALPEGVSPRVMNGGWAISPARKNAGAKADENRVSTPLSPKGPPADALAPMELH